MMSRMMLTKLMIFQLFLRFFFDVADVDVVVVGEVVVVAVSLFDIYIVVDIVALVFLLL